MTEHPCCRLCYLVCICRTGWFIFFSKM